MKKLKLYEYITYAAIILAGVGLDQLTKFLAVKYLEPVSTVPIIKNVLHLTFVTNDGMAFGMLDNQRWIFMSVSVIMIAVLCYLLFAGRLESKLYTVSVAMIISGGIGNMIDRIALGEVVDFIDFRAINFAVFNVADSIVCVGAGLLVLALILEIARDQKKAKSQGADEEKTNADEDGTADGGEASAKDEEASK